MFLLFDPVAPTILVRELRRFDGRVLHSTLDEGLVAEIRAALDESL